MKSVNLKKMLLPAGAGMTALLCSCISVDYREIADFPPLPDDIRVVTYYDQTQIPVPEKERTLVGDATANASTASYSMQEIKQKLVRMARAHGANVILILAVDHKFTGHVRSDQVKNMLAPSWTTVDDSGSDIKQQREMNFYSSGKEPNLPVYRVTIKARFYKIPDRAQEKKNLWLPDQPPKTRTELKKHEEKESVINIH